MSEEKSVVGQIVGAAVGAVLGAIIIALLVGVIGALPTMWLWNWLMPTIFGVKAITFWQAFGLNILCNILFKSSSSKKGE